MDKVQLGTHQTANECMIILLFWVFFPLISQYGDTTHTLIEYLSPYKGLFLPGYREPLKQDPLLAKL